MSLFLINKRREIPKQSEIKWSDITGIYEYHWILGFQKSFVQKSSRIMIPCNLWFNYYLLDKI